MDINHKSAETHIDKNSVHVYAACEYYLYLDTNGTLYGNSSWYLEDMIKNDVSDDAPYKHTLIKGIAVRKISENVVSVAAGRDYFIFLRKDGMIEICGRGQFVGRIVDVSDAVEVYAEPHQACFMVRDKLGKMYCLGNNSKEGIAAYKEHMLESRILHITQDNTVYITPVSGGDGETVILDIPRLFSETVLIDNIKQYIRNVKYTALCGLF